MIRSISMPNLSHHTESLERLNKPLGDAIVGANGGRQPILAKKSFKSRKSKFGSRRGLGSHINKKRDA